VGSTGQSFTATSNGSYAVEITENGCVETSNCVSITSASISNENMGIQLIVYPNPNNGLFHISFPETLLGQTTRLTNSIGQIIETGIVHSTLIDYDLSNLSFGIYFIQVQTTKGMITQKIVKN
jgi:hypothetical protein